MKKILVYINREFPFYSVLLQTEMLVSRIEEIYGIRVQYIEKSSISKHININSEVILWPIDSFKFELLRYSSFKNVVFIYHNITPWNYFWKHEPLVAIRSAMGRMQLRFLKYTKASWVAVSPYNASELQAIGIKDVKYCPNIINNNTSKITKTEKPSLIYNGRIVQNKGCIELLRVVEKVAIQLGKPVSLYIIGGGKKSSSYYKSFVQRLRELGTNSLIEFIWLQGIASEQLYSLYGKCWLYVTMSRHEGFGLPVCESIVSGTPALYIKCGGQESVLNNIGLCEESTISDSILSLLKDEKLRNELYRSQYREVSKYIIPYVDMQIKEVYSRFFVEEKDANG